MPLRYHGHEAGRRPVPPSAPSSGGSALPYRPGAVPGYTGFITGSMSVPPAVHTRLTERAPGVSLVPHPEARAAAEAAEEAAVGKSTNATAFDPGALEQHDYMAAGARASRPAAAAAAPTTARIVEQPGFGRSTYQLELLERDCSDIGGGPVAPRGAAPGGGSGAPSPAAQAARPGYLTTSAAAQLLMAEQFGSALSLSGGSSPAAKAALGGRGGSGAGSPAAAAEPGSWTIRAAQPAPGPACQPSSIATKASPGSGPGGRGRVPKEAAFLAALDQHSRGRVPAYTGHRPQHNVSLEPPPPTKLTKWGAASQAALRRTPPPPDSSHAIDSRKGLLSFFAAGVASEFVSENGLAEAARYHEAVRPLEGRMRVPQALHTNRCGAKFAG